MKTRDRFAVTQDNQLHSKLRQVARELLEWAERGDKGKIGQRDTDRMRFEASELEKLISNKEL